MNRRKGVTPESAVKLCCEKVGPGDIEEIKLTNAVSRVCAQSIIALADIPDFKRSMVDGYVISIDDVRKGINRLKVTAVIPAGYGEEITLKAGQCARIMTGAPIPRQAAAVIKQEDVKNESDTITFTRAINDNENIQFPGSRFKKGQILVSAGQELSPQKIEVLAAAGIVKIPAYRLPRIYIINTGSETITPGNHLTKGKIYQSNHALLFSKVSCAGCEAPMGSGATRDDISQISMEIETGLRLADVIIITGGTSGGDYDLVLPSLEQNDTELLFTSIKTRPGKNVTAAVKKGKLILNLPGNPGAVNILFDALIAPVIKKTKGIEEYENKWISIKLSDPVSRIKSQRTLIQAELIEHKTELMARPLRKNHDFTGIKSMIIDLKPGQGREGEIVRGLIL